ncbi:MAG TPA: hypothetical protein VFX70_17525 [Mycobacteriales bacterium]|nr:hypothetical protein [Mycobacteriales bacterium]
MATVEECEQALRRLAAALRGPGGDQTRQQITDRTVSCHLTDLDVTFAGTLRDDGLHGISRTGDRAAQIRLAMTSDDLLALTDGSLTLLSAWTSGRVSIRAGVFDLLRLRRLL